MELRDDGRRVGSVLRQCGSQQLTDHVVLNVPCVLLSATGCDDEGDCGVVCV